MALSKKIIEEKKEFTSEMDLIVGESFETAINTVNVEEKRKPDMTISYISVAFNCK